MKRISISYKKLIVYYMIVSILLLGWVRTEITPVFDLDQVVPDQDNMFCGNDGTNDRWKRIYGMSWRSITKRI